MKFVSIAVCGLVFLSGCDQLGSGGQSGGSAKGVSGPKQEIRIVTAPDGAKCALDFDNKTFDRTGATPVNISVPKTGKPLTVRCIKSGYSQGQSVVKPGTNNEYDSPVLMTLNKKK